MEWTAPAFARNKVNDAAKAFIEGQGTSDESFEDVLYVINNWRASHAFPLNTFQNTLRRKSRDIYKYSLVAQRIKRLPAIELKLQLMPNLRLTQMQDIGGCRCVVNSVRSVTRLTSAYKRSSIRHNLVHFDDYIEQPKDSGYRGIHLVYSYASDQKPEFNGLKIEMQLRTTLQHAWATAVETVSAFTGDKLKSGAGDARWLRFFALMGSAIAIREKQPLVPGTPDNATDLVKELRDCTDELDVIGHLASYRALLNHSNRPPFRNLKYFLLELDPKRGHVQITRFGRQDVVAASDQYLAKEQRALTPFSGEASDAVLVSVDSLRALRRAYPNYFADTKTFVRELQRVTKSIT